MTDFQHPSDGFYMIEARGEFPNVRAGVVQVIDDKAIKSIVANFNKEASDPQFPGMLVDHEHFKHDEDKETRAYGWLMELQARPSGIFGRIRWTATGQAAVDGGDYRFFSSEFDSRDMEVVSSKPKRLRPLRLDGLTLTNKPNNSEGQTPITNRMNDKTTPMTASQAAYDLSASADSADAHAEAAKAHRQAAQAHQDAGHANTAQRHADLAKTHDRTAAYLRDADDEDEDLEPLANRLTPEIASAELRRQAEVHAAQTGRSFSESYRLISQTNPKLVEAAASRPVGDTVTTRHHNRVVAEAARVEGEVMTRRLIPINDGRFSSERHDAIAQIRNRKEPRISYAEAYEIAKREKPEFWFEEAPEEADPAGKRNHYDSRGRFTGYY